MTICISNVQQNKPSEKPGFLGMGKEIQDGIFMFEDQGENKIYSSMAEYESDLADDGELNNSKSISEIKKGYDKEMAPLLDELSELKGFCSFNLIFASEDTKDRVAELEAKIAEVKANKKEACKTEDTTLEDIANEYTKQSNGATQLSNSAQQNINGIDTSAKKANEDSADDKELINEKNEEIAKLREEMKQYEKEQKALQEEELAKAIEKAEKEYDPEKHGDNKEAYINKQVAGIIDPAKTQSTELKDELKALETEVSNLLDKIAGRNKINRQNSFTKLNMNVQNTYSTATSEHAETYKAKTLSIAA